MQSIVLVAAALGLAMPTIASPLAGSSKIEARTTVDGILTCDSNIVSSPITAQRGAAAYTVLCIQSLRCQHSVAPTLAVNEFIGSCIGCPVGISENAIGDCIFVTQ